MDLGTRGALAEACLCLVFVYGLLQWRVKMGFKDRLQAMQSHKRKRRRPRLSIPEIGLLSLCSPDGLTSQTLDGCRISLENKFYTQKESLSRFASTSSAVHRTSLLSKVSFPKFKLTQKKASASVQDPYCLAHRVHHGHDRDTEGSFPNDVHSDDSGWHLVSRGQSLKSSQPCKIAQSCSAGMTRVPRSPPYPVVTAADVRTTHNLTYPGIPRETAAAAADASEIKQTCMAGLAHPLHPPKAPFESITTAADVGMVHKRAAACESASTAAVAAAADALVSFHDSAAASLVDVTADTHAPVCEVGNPLVSPHKPFACTEATLVAHAAPHILASMERTGCAPFVAPLPGLPGSNEVEMFQSRPAYKLLLESGRSRDSRLKDLQSEIAATKSRLEALKVTRKEVFPRKKRDSFDQEEHPMSAAFTPLSKEEEEEVHDALNGANRHQVLVQHEPSNIDLSRAALQCLKPGAWLNDEVINLYMELLKERERREQKGYLKCHFFNTFFFNKLYKDALSYDFKAVRRWTTQRKLGYSLLECDKIFVPIHKDIHWCLAVINIREKKLQYLDSLKGPDGSALQVLARYIKDEAKDKGAEDVDMGSWQLDCPQDIPAQTNGCDCGMFMIKYANFLSRGNELTFTQHHMAYFRKRTVLELLQLKAR